MSNSGTAQGIYSPLSQTITDSDSEEELHNSLTSKKHNCNNNMQDKLTKNGQSALHRFQSETIDESNGYVLGIDGHADSVSILQPEKSIERMSPLRKFFFILSIFVCFLTVIVFLWVLPCSQECLSSAAIENKKSSWENPYHDIELKGTINVVNGVVGREKNLILLFRGDVVNPEHPEGVRASSDNGIILIVGSSGKVGWFIRQPRLPTDIDCTLIDVDKDGHNDCIVIGEEGLFAAINPTTGTVYWYLHNHDNGNDLFTSIDFPIVLMDIDGDNVDDMLATCTPYKEKFNNALILISGYRGSIIGSPMTISECTSIDRLQIDKDQMINYTCKNNTTLSESLKTITLEELYGKITNKPLLKWRKNWVISEQHQTHENRDERNVYFVDGRKLIVENQGHCPKNCKVVVQLIDERNSKDNISWEYSASRVHGMVPATLMFNNSLVKNRIAGFVLKFWQWNSGTKNRYDRDVELNTYNIFDNSSHTEYDIKNKSTKRNPSKKTVKRNNVTVNHITERVVLVTFNATNVHIVNASQCDIIQMCLNDKAEPVCQPNLNFQENSLLIADLDGDGSQELVTYLTTFACSEAASLDEYYGDVIKCDADWRLKSTIRIVRLEAELPKLYEAVSHH